MLSELKKRMDREDEGFTLIELMVVVLIIAILLAIAIPTFLGARNSANARSTQSNLRNALTAEQTNWTNTQAFTANGATIEPSLSWPTALTGAGKKEVLATPGTGSDVSLVGWGKDTNCYAVYQNNGTSSAANFTAYAAWASGGAACTAPTVPTSPATAPAGGAVGTAAPTATTGWYTSW